MEKHVFFSCSLEELEKLIKDCIKSELKNHLAIAPALKTEFISRKKAASILGISLATLGDYCKRGVIPSYRIGSRVLFKENEVIESVSQVKNLKHKKGIDY